MLNDAPTVVWPNSDKEWNALQKSISQIENILMKVPSKIDDSECWGGILKDYIDSIESAFDKIPDVDKMEAKNSELFTELEFWEDNVKFTDNIIDDIIDMFDGVAIYIKPKEKSRTEMMDWCHKTLTDKFLYYNINCSTSAIIFKSKSDAVLFKLRWT